MEKSNPHGLNISDKHARKGRSIALLETAPPIRCSTIEKLVFNRIEPEINQI